MEVVAHGGVGREIAREIAPLAAGPEAVEDRVQNIPQRMAAVVMLRRMRLAEHQFHEAPLGVRQVGGVAFTRHARKVENSATPS